jgi:hypothetical protein
MNDNSTHARALRRAQEKARARDELRWLERLATDLDLNEQLCGLITQCVARHVVTLQVLEECTSPAAQWG